jgi:hypothetical protein
MIKIKLLTWLIVLTLKAGKEVLFTNLRGKLSFLF